MESKSEPEMTILSLTDHERKVIDRYRNRPELQALVNSMLNVTKEDE